MRLTSTFILLLLLPSIAAHSQSASRADTSAVNPLARLDSLLEDVYDARDTADRGYALIVLRGGQPLYSRHAGSISPSTAVPIASASKWLAGAVIMSLVDEGRLALDDTLGRFFRGLSSPVARITVRQLMSLTSGLPADAPCLSRRTGSLASCAEEILASARRVMPGRRFEYGGASMQVAGRVAEIAGGAPWEQLFRARIAEPLGMRSTTFSAISPDNPRIAGGASSSAEDYTRFLVMIANGGAFEGRRVLSERAVREVLADQTRGAAMRMTLYPTGDGAVAPTRLRYGIGVWRESFTRDGREHVEHSSPGALGFVPWYDPENGVVGVLATFRPLREVMPMAQEIRRVVRSVDGGSSPAVNPPSSGPARRLTDAAGTSPRAPASVRSTSRTRGRPRAETRSSSRPT